MITDAFVAEIQLLTENLRAAVNDPADQIRILSNMAGFVPTISPNNDDATASVCRRAALASLARAVADYRPLSKDEVSLVLVAIVPLFDSEIQNAADVGDLQSYSQLRELRTSVVSDLRTRGLDLPELITVARPTSLPSLVLAWQLYADASREDELVVRNDPIHPAFMPASFQALSS